MVANWGTYIRNLLILAFRQNCIVAFIQVLNSHAETMNSELDAFIADARLRSAVTWQVCWLEKLLTDEIGGTITITEADGLPVDFVVTGISYQYQNRARALLNRYKLAGKSYVFEFIDLEVSAAWSDGVCELEVLVVPSAAWSDGVCALIPAPTYTLQLTVDPSSTGEPGLLSVDIPGPYEYGTVVEITAGSNYSGGYFWRWEIYLSGSWSLLSNDAIYEHTIIANTQIRAFYSDMNQ